VSPQGRCSRALGSAGSFNFPPHELQRERCGRLGVPQFFKVAPQRLFRCDQAGAGGARLQVLEEFVIRAILGRIPANVL